MSSNHQDSSTSEEEIDRRIQQRKIEIQQAKREAKRQKRQQLQLLEKELDQIRNEGSNNNKNKNVTKRRKTKHTSSHRSPIPSTSGAQISPSRARPIVLLERIDTPGVNKRPRGRPMRDDVSPDTRLPFNERLREYQRRRNRINKREQRAREKLRDQISASRARKRQREMAARRRKEQASQIIDENSSDH